MSESIRFDGVVLSAADPARVGRFWSELRQWPLRSTGPAESVLMAPGSVRFVVRRGVVAKEAQNRIHFDLPTDSPDHFAELVSRALRLGGARIDIGQGAEEGHEVLVDPEGNELCIIEPGNNFLADTFLADTFLAGTGAIGAINCDGSQALGYFFRDLLEWPLVWDQDEETVVQAPEGGVKITWSGPPLLPQPPRDRFHLVLAGTPDRVAERVCALGGRVDAEGKLRDVDGNILLTRADLDG